MHRTAIILIAYKKVYFVISFVIHNNFSIDYNSSRARYKIIGGEPIDFPYILRRLTSHCPIKQLSAQPPN